MLRIPHSLHNRLTDVCKLSVSRTGRAQLHKTLIFLSDIHLCSRLRKPQGLVLLKGRGKSIKFNYVIGSRTRALPACSTVIQSERYRMTPLLDYTHTDSIIQMWAPYRLSGYELPANAVYTMYGNIHFTAEPHVIRMQ
jgi:hypothetical protein